MSRRATQYQQATTAFSDGVARICQLYGISPLAGRLYAHLFLSPEPVALEDLCAQVGAAKSTVSVALRRWAAFRVVRRLPPGPDRRDFWEAVTDPWAILADWSRLYLQPEIDMWRETSLAVESALKGKTGDVPRGRANAALRVRIAHVREFLELFEGLVGGIARRGPAAERARSISISLDDEGER